MATSNVSAAAVKGVRTRYRNTLKMDVDNARRLLEADVSVLDETVSSRDEMM